MQKYMTLMSAYGKDAGIDFNFHGTVANTIDAHRLIQHCQETKSAEVANKVVDCKSLLSSFSSCHSAFYSSSLASFGRKC